SLGTGTAGSSIKGSDSNGKYILIPEIIMTRWSGAQIWRHYNNFINNYNEDNGAYGFIGKFTSWIANSIDSTNEEFPQITNPAGLARTDFDPGTWKKFRPGDRLFTIDWGNFLAPAKLPDGKKISFGDRANAFGEGIKTAFDVLGLIKIKPDSTMSVYSTWTYSKDGSFRKLDTTTYIKNG